MANREPDPLFEALCCVQGVDPRGDLSKDERGQINAACASICSAIAQYKDADPGLRRNIRASLAKDVPKRAEAYKRAHPDWHLSAKALSSHWSECADTAGTRTYSELRRNIESMCDAWIGLHGDLFAGIPVMQARTVFLHVAGAWHGGHWSEREVKIARNIWDEGMPYEGISVYAAVIERVRKVFEEHHET